MTFRLSESTAFLFSVMLLISVCLSVNAEEKDTSSIQLNSEKVAYEEALTLLRKSKSDLALEKLFELKETIAPGHELENKITISIAEGYRQRREYKKGLNLLYELIRKNEIAEIDKVNAFNRIAALYNEGPASPGRFDSVIKYSEICINIAEANEYMAELATSQNELGYVYGFITDYKNQQKSIELLNAALENFRSEGLFENAVNVSLNLGRVYLTQNKYIEAHQVIDRAMTFCKIENNKNLFRRLYIQKSAIYKSQNNFEKAFYFMRESRILTESFYNDRLNQNISEMAAKYEAGKKERENLELRKNNEIQALKLSYKNRTILFLSIGLIIAGLFALVIFLLLRRKMIVNKNLVEKNLELAQFEKIAMETDGYFLFPQKHTNFHNPDNDFKGKEEVIIKKLIKYFNEEKPYLYNQISQEDVSAQLGTNRTYLSNAIKDILNKNFNTLINEFRIKAARQIILDNKYEHLSLEAIARMVGYNSRTSFISNFKKFTGLTPSFFRDSVKGKR